MRLVYKTKDYEVEVEMAEQEAVVFGSLVARMIANSTASDKPSDTQTQLLESILTATKSKGKKNTEA